MQTLYSFYIKKSISLILLILYSLKNNLIFVELKRHEGLRYVQVINKSFFREILVI